MKKINVMLGMVLVYLLMILVGCKKIDHGKDVVKEEVVLQRHEIISYNEVAPNRYSIYFKWDSGAIDSLLVPASVLINNLIDKPRVSVFYTYREYKDGTYNYTIILEKNIYIYKPK